MEPAPEPAPGGVRLVETRELGAQQLLERLDALLREVARTGALRVPELVGARGAARAQRALDGEPEPAGAEADAEAGAGELEDNEPAAQAELDIGEEGAAGLWVDGARRQATSGRVRTVRNARALQRVVRSMAAVAALLAEGRTVTLRGLYYDQKGKAQEEQSVAALLSGLHVVQLLAGCTRSSLHVFAQARGVVSGQVTVVTTTWDGAAVEEAAGEAPLALRGDAARAGATAVRASRPHAPPTWLLLVEKETVFQALVGLGAARELNCVLITGKGQPCLATRAFAALVVDELRLPVLALVDFNPDGLGIALTYAHGGAEPEGYLHAMPGLKVLGVLSDDVRRFGRGAHGLQTQPLTERDVRRAEGLARAFAGSSTCDVAFEAGEMLAQGDKCEIEAIAAARPPDPRRLLHWLAARARALLAHRVRRELP
jgi:meiotic recombination protein SPO11